jgi:two-component system response regulator AlgR
MDILIVDDEPLARARLTRLINDIPNYHVIGEAGNADDAMHLIESLDPDIVVLDVRMPGDNGVILAKKIGLLDDAPAIIFCSAYEEYALAAFATTAIGYLVKPIRTEDLLQALEKATNINKLQKQHLLELAQQDAAKLALTPDFITAKHRLGISRILLDDVYYFMADQKYVTVVHKNGEHLIDQSLKELEELYNHALLRSHRNTLVNKKHLTGIARKPNGQFAITFDDCSHQPQISRRHLPLLRQFLSEQVI